MNKVPMRNWFGVIAYGGGCTCTNCAISKGILGERMYSVGYPDGYTCDECGECFFAETE